MEEESSVAVSEAQAMEVEETEGNVQGGEAGGEPDTSQDNTLVEGQALDESFVTVDEEKAEEGKDSSAKNVMWRLRVCPILFVDFSTLKKEFQAMIKLSSYFEYRMSQHLCTRIEAGAWTDAENMEKDLPWLPNEKTYTKPQNAATAGMIEINVDHKNLVNMMTLIRTAKLSKRNRLRFELKQLVPKEEEVKTKEVKAEEVNTEEVNTEGEVTMEGDEATKEDKAEGEAKKLSGMIVNFAVRLKPVKVPAFSHPEGYELKAEDKQIFLSKVPADVPDYVLRAVLLSKFLYREEAEDGSSTVVFEVNSQFSAQGYMELFDGILLNYKEIEMATSLGTLHEAKKKHSAREMENRQANEKQVKAMKRKPEGPPVGQQDAKKPRGEKLDSFSQIWLRGTALLKGTRVAATRGATPLQGLQAVQGAGVRARRISRGAAVRPLTRAGLAGRGVRGAPMRGRGVLGRGLPGGGRGAQARGLRRGAPPGGRGVAGAGATRSRVFVRGGTRAMPARGGRGLLGASPSSRGGRGMGYQGIEDLQAKLMATERELEILQASRMADFHGFDREAAYRDDRFSPRGGFDNRDYFDEGYDDHYEHGFPAPRRRW